MLIGKRQTFFECSNIPKILYCEKPNIKGYEKLVEIFVELIMKKQCYYYKFKEKFEENIYKEIIEKERLMYRDCISQTIHFLKNIKVLEPMKKIEQIELWKKFIKMTPIYEGICCQLQTTLVKHYCSEMYEEMLKGHIYSHQRLTDIKEVILYVMEYFFKENLLKKIVGKEFEIKN